MTCLDSMLCLLTSVLKTRFYWAFPFLSNFTSCYWENRRIGYDNQIVMKFVMIYSSTFFYLFFVFFSSSSSSLYFDKFKVFVHFEFVFSQRCLTLLYLGPYWLRKKYSDIILTKILRKHNTKLDPNYRITKCCPAKWLIWSCEKL